MPTVFSMTSMVIHVLIALGLNYLANNLRGSNDYVAFTMYFVVLAHSRFVLLEKIYKFSTMYLSSDKSNTSKENKDEKLG